jgi:type IV pilus assembly protein PilE
MRRIHGPGKISGGFTLIELMIVVAVVAILASIAIPSYTQYVIRSNRTEGKVLLMQSAQSLERCYSRFGAYTNTSCEGLFPQTSESGFYEVDFPGDDDVAANSFTLSAVPQGTQATRDTKCGTLTLNHVGQKGLGTTATGTVDECW